VVKTRGRDGVVFQLQAFGRHPRGPVAAGWYAERYWPARYGPAWVLARLREYLGRPSYRPLIPLAVPPAVAVAVAAAPVAEAPAPPADGARPPAPMVSVGPADPAPRATP
jgi:hypothetical protein